jgi:tetratricopeptide (TPR) repeat protein
VGKLLRIRWPVVVCAALLVAGTVVPWQSPHAAAQGAPTPADQAAAALNAGRYEDVETLLQGATDSLAAALRARAEIARGRYAEAEKLLIGPAGREVAGDAALELGLLQMYLGRRADGERTLDRLIDRTNGTTVRDLVRVARAARAVGEFNSANDFFRAANKASPNNPAVNTPWGEMQLDKGDPDAPTSFRLALEAQATNVDALVGLARVASQSDRSVADGLVAKALSINPNSVPAHLVVAEMELDSRKRDKAHEAIAAALKVNPNSLEALALAGAAALLEDKRDEFERRAAEAQKLNPTYGEVYRVAGDHLARNYRFEEAIPLTRRALSIDGQNARAHADLGLHLLRVGDEKGARASLETAYKLDPFYSQLVTKNLLENLDLVDKFDTITDGDIIMKFSPEETPVMREHALPLAREALATLQKRYNFTVQGPILIEMFPVHDDFAVRTLGLPGMVGALGVCFGKVVTLDSPRARPPGEFNWGETLWHELAHVITLQMSNNRLPRWASEGISGFEERRGRPEWGRDGELQFAQAMNDDKVLPIADLNEGFADGRTIGLAYIQSALFIEHLVERFGEPAMHAMVRAYATGREDAAVFKEVFATDVDDIQRSFTAKIEKQFAATREALKGPELKEKPNLTELRVLAPRNPGSFAVQMQLGQALFEAGDNAAAIAAFEKAAELLPRANGANNPHGYIAAVAQKMGDNPRAIRALEAKVAIDSSDVDAARRLAQLLTPLDDAQRLEAAYARVVAVDPFDGQSQSAYGRLLMRKKDVPGALKAFRTAIATNIPDRAVAHTDLAEALLASKQPDEAKKETLAALEIAPSYERAQDLLLQIVGEGK